MVQIAFHFNVPDKLSYACRLLRKAYAAGSTVAVLGDAPFLKKLDEQLWSFSALDFLPHVFPSGDQAADALSPIWLVENVMQAQQGAGRQVLVNFTSNVPQGFEVFERLIEVVSTLESDRLLARQRWKHYSERGYTLIRHDLNLNT